MKTASYYTYRGSGRVGISVGRPRFVGGTLPFYGKLAPRRDMLRLGYDEYRAIFFDDILAKLDPARAVRDLERLTGGAEPVLLCFERPPFNADNWCHRRMVAEWFERELGIAVPEIGGGQ